MSDSLFEQIADELFDEEGKPVKRMCGVCGKILPIEEFFKNGKGPGGVIHYRRDCKLCYKKANIGRTQAWRDKKWSEKYGEPSFDSQG